MKSPAGLVLALVLIASVTGCGKRSYTVTVTEPAPARTAPDRAEPLDRLRASAERLRDSAARAAAKGRQAAASIGTDITQPSATGTSGTSSKGAAGSPPAVNGEDPGIGPGGGRTAEPRGTPPTTAAAPDSSDELPLDSIALVLLAGAAAAAAALALRRRRSV